MKKTLLAAILLGALSALFLSACSNNEPSLPWQAEPTTDQDQVNINAADGGFSTSDEPVAFADADVANESGEDENVADAISSDTDTEAGLNSETIKSYILRITFGLLEGDSSATEVVDWSGYAEINKGTLALLKTVRFENSDYIHLPRQSRLRLEFTAQTRPHFDGLLLAVVDNDTSQSAVDGYFTFAAGSYMRTFAFSELDSLDLLEPVGASGHEISIVSRAKEIIPFSGGFLAGRWLKETPTGGVFYGRWMNSLGTMAGHLRGIWGVNRFGERVFYGKFISLNGRFRGLLRGSWEFNLGEDGGRFKGYWVDRYHKVIGTLNGHWKSGRPGDGKGYFHGRYRRFRDTDG